MHIASGVDPKIPWWPARTIFAECAMPVTCFIYSCIFIFLPYWKLPMFNCYWTLFYWQKFVWRGGGMKFKRTKRSSAMYDSYRQSRIWDSFCGGGYKIIIFSGGGGKNASKLVYIHLVMFPDSHEYFFLGGRES